MTPRSSCPGGEGTPLRGAANLWHCQINTLPQPPPSPRILPQPRSTAFCPGPIPRRNRVVRLADDPYSLAGSVLGSKGGLLFASAEAQIPTTSSHYQQLRPLIEQLFTTATTTLLEGVDSALITQLTTSGTSVELIYDKPAELHTSVGDGSDLIRVDRILIQLTGSHARWILYGTGYYQSGPFFTADTQTVATILNLISSTTNRN